MTVLKFTHMSAQAKQNRFEKKKNNNKIILSQMRDKKQVKGKNHPHDGHEHTNKYAE